MSDEWGPWIEHDGGPCPCVGEFVDARDVEGDIYQCFADELYWPHDERTNATWWIVRYRIRKPRALEQLREIARNPERELEDA